MLHTHPDRRRGLVRAGLTALTALAVAGATLAAPTGAQAALSLAGPINPQNDFPSFYTEQSGATSVQLCIDESPECGLAGPGDLTAPDGEAFYYSAIADIPVGAGVVSVEFALEAAFAGDGDGQQIVFDRFRIRGEAPPGTYTLQHPFGDDSVTSTEQPGPNINATDDVGCADVPCDFNRALGGRMTNFLRSTSSTLPPGYLGDGATPTTVTGGQRNFVRLIGPGGTFETNEFIVMGKTVDGPVATLSSTAVEFGNLASGSQPVRVTNTGTEDLTITAASVAPANGFAVAANPCPAPIAPGASCVVNVTYASAAIAPSAQATLSLAASTGLIRIGLHATSLPAVSVSGGPLAFGAQKVGTTGAARGVTLVNTGVVALPPVTASTTGPFTAPTGCAAPLAPGASCTVSTSYLPTAHGGQTGTLTINHASAANATTSSVSLSGSGTTPVALVNRTSIDFGRARVRTTTPQRVVRLSNTGDAAMAIRAASTTGPFKVRSSDCPASLAPGAFCHIGVTFRPTRLGEAGGALRLGHDAVSGPQAVALQGRGSRVGAPSAPRAVVARSGRPGGKVTAAVSWRAPRSTGGAAIKAYRVSIRKVGATKVATRVVRSSARSLTVARLVRGARYRFAVRAVNGVGPSIASPFSSAVRAR
jgi:hypothetical protein